VSETYKRPYVESSVWIGWIKGETHTEVDNVTGNNILIDRKAILDHILKQAERGDFEIFTSSLTLIEVNKIMTRSPEDNALSEKIIDFFENEYIKIVEADRLLGVEGNRMLRNTAIFPTGKKLKTIDAVHLASAIRVKSDYLLTWDKDLLVCKPPNLIVSKPQMLGQGFMI
jgi:predicted nucleic acid-binding protein